MRRKSTYYKYLDIIRIFLVGAVFLYHLDILKGGYLAVCSFFTLSGYLACYSLTKKKNYSLKDYYKKRIKRLYLPLIIVVFCLVPFVFFIKDFVWINFKEEILSIFLGFNNYWQLGNNLDYFAKSINSPFIHLWYVSVLIQFNLVFPFIYEALTKIKGKFNKIAPCLITLVLCYFSGLLFFKYNGNGLVLEAYYDTFTRAFSLFGGAFFGFLYAYYDFKKIKKLKKAPYNKRIFYSYLFLLLLMFIFVDVNSKYYVFSMFLTTFITGRLIFYSININDKSKCNWRDKVIKSMANMSYEIYLVQYPIIFFFQYFNLNNVIKVLLIIIFTLIISSFISWFLNPSKEHRKLKKHCYYFLIPLMLLGIFELFIKDDQKQAMKELEKQLVANALMIQERQDLYEANYKLEEEKLQQALKEIEGDESKLESIINELHIVGIGDSIMLGATPNLYEQFPNGYFDAKVSRTPWVANDILIDLKSKNMLGDPIVLNLGANGDCSTDCKKEIMQTCENRDVFWVNVTNDKDVHVNSKLEAFAENYENLHVIDWNSISKDHREYFGADGIHLTGTGRTAYVKAVYEAIYKVYAEEYSKKKEELIESYENEKNNILSFYGNDLLLNVFDNIGDNFSDAKFIIKDFNLDLLKEELNNSLTNESLSNRIVFAFDNSFKLTVAEYEELFKICENKKIYVIALTEEVLNYINNLNNENIVAIDFYHAILENEEYLLRDGIHLSKEGNRALSDIIKKLEES